MSVSLQEYGEKPEEGSFDSENPMRGGILFALLPCTLSDSRAHNYWRN